MKKFIAIACILAMCLGVLAGCMEKVDNSVDTSAPVGVALVYGVCIFVAIGYLIFSKQRSLRNHS